MAGTLPAETEGGTTMTPDQLMVRMLLSPERVMGRHDRQNVERQRRSRRLGLPRRRRAAAAELRPAAAEC